MKLPKHLRPWSRVPQLYSSSTRICGRSRSLPRRARPAAKSSRVRAFLLRMSWPRSTRWNPIRRSEEEPDMGLLRGVARTAVVAGTATAVSGRVQRRQQARWNAQEAPQEYAQPQYAQPEYE